MSERPSIFEENPELSGNLPGQPLFEALKVNLPADLPAQHYEAGLSCYGYARLMVLQLGRDRANIYMVRWLDGDDKENYQSHAYVVVDGSSPQSLALNNYLGYRLTVEEVLRRGKNVTEEIFNTDWSQL